MPVLVYRDTRGATHRHVLAKDRASVGRHGKNDLVLADSLVSRNHCLIEKRDGEQWALVDLGSSFGTWVNDERVNGAKLLRFGDVLKVGNFRLSFLSGSEGDDAATGGSDDGEQTGTGKAATDSGRPPLAEEIADVRRLAHELGEWVDALPPGAHPPRETIEQLQKKLGRVAAGVVDLERNRILAQTLAEAGKLMSLIRDLDAVLEVTLDLAVRALGADRGYVLLAEEDGRVAVRVARNMGDVRGISSHIAADVVKSGAPIVTTDAQVDPRYAKNESVAMHAIRAVMCVPLRDKDLRTIGAIYVDGRPGLRLFDDRGVGFLSGFASHAAAAIESARLAEKSREDARQRERLSRYLSEPVIAQILGKGTGEQHLRREITVLFTDVRGFTTILERLEPEEAVEMLDDYFGEIAQEVFAAEGTLDKFTGDGLMAFWNAPALQPDHALRAVRAALRMQSRLPAMLARWKREKRSFLRWVTDLPTGIGVHTGVAVVGAIGPPNRKEFTAIGDAVNVAARVQALAGGGEVIVTDATRAKLGGEIEAEALPAQPLKGKSQPVALHRVRLLRSGI